MADLFAAKDANGATVYIYSDEITGPLGGPAQKQLTGIIDATTGSANPLVVDSAGRIGVKQSVGEGFTLLHGVLNTATLGDNSLVAAQGAGKVIYLVSFEFICAAAIGVQWKSGGNNLTGVQSYGANGGMVHHGKPSSPVRWTNANEALILTLSGVATQVSGDYTYIVV